MKNHYKVLGIGEAVSAEEIKLAYRLNAKRYHPDLNPDNESYQKRFLEIKEAYEILSDSEARKKYDQELQRHLKAKEAAKTAGQTAPPFSGGQSRAGSQGYGYAQGNFRPQGEGNGARAQAAPPPPDVNAASQAGDSLRQAQEKILKERQARMLKHIREKNALEVELAQASAREEILKYRQNTNKQVQAFKVRMLADREKLRKRYSGAIDRFARKLKIYKQNIKRSTYYAGVRDGIKSAQQSAVSPAEELKALIASGGGADGESLKRAQVLQVELDLIQSKNAELARQIELIERLANTENAQILRDEEAAMKQGGTEFEKVSAERDRLAIEMLEYEQETERLGDEVMRLEKALELWRAAAADGVITEKELKQVRAYEESQLKKSDGSLYGVLGVYLNALPEEIKAAYEKLSKRYEGKEKYLERYMEIVEAYRVLSDPAEKLSYDTAINNTTEV